MNAHLILENAFALANLALLTGMGLTLWLRNGDITSKN